MCVWCVCGGGGGVSRVVCLCARVRLCVSECARASVCVCVCYPSFLFPADNFFFLSFFLHGKSVSLLRKFAFSRTVPMPESSLRRT